MTPGSPAGSGAGASNGTTNAAEPRLVTVAMDATAIAPAGSFAGVPVGVAALAPGAGDPPAPPPVSRPRAASPVAIPRERRYGVNDATTAETAASVAVCRRTRRSGDGA